MKKISVIAGIGGAICTCAGFAILANYSWHVFFGVACIKLGIMAAIFYILCPEE